MLCREKAILSWNEIYEREFFESQSGFDRVLLKGGMNATNNQQVRTRENSRDAAEDCADENQKAGAAVV